METMTKFQNSLNKKFVPDPRMETPSAWVNHRGIYYPVAVAEHDHWAWEYLGEKYGKLDAGIKIAGVGGYAHLYLEKAGWARIMAWPGLDTKFILPKKLSHAQKQTIDRYCSIYGYPLPFKDPLF